MMTLRELVYDLLDQGRRDGEFPLDRDSIDLIAAGIQEKLDYHDAGDHRSHGACSYS